MAGDEEIGHGGDSARRRTWGDVYGSLSPAARSGSLPAEDLELLAAAAYLLGNVDECRQVLERAHRAYVATGDPRRATRCVFWVAFTLLLEGDVAPASGWLARANRLLDDERHECAEHGLLLFPGVVQATASGDYASAAAAAARAAEVGARVDDADLLARAALSRSRWWRKAGCARAWRCSTRRWSPSSPARCGPPGRKHLLLDDRRLPGDLRPPACAGMDHGTGGVVVHATGTDDVHRPVSDPPRRAHATTRRLAGGTRGDEAGMRAAGARG